MGFKKIDPLVKIDTPPGQVEVPKTLSNRTDPGFCSQQVSHAQWTFSYSEMVKVPKFRNKKPGQLFDKNLLHKTRRFLLITMNLDAQLCNLQLGAIVFG